MLHALLLSAFCSAFLVLTTLSGTTGDTGTQLPRDYSDEPTVQIFGPSSSLISGDIEEEKRSWRDLQNGWGKRGWKDLHAGGWGKRGWKDLQSTGWGKRSWGDLHNGWGKRSRWDLENDFKGGNWAKRDWKQFRGGWGKRNLYYSPYPQDLDDYVGSSGSN